MARGIQLGDRELQRRLRLGSELEVVLARPGAVARDADREAALAAHREAEERTFAGVGSDGRPPRPPAAREGVEQQRGVGDRAGERTGRDETGEPGEARHRGDAAARGLEPDEPGRGGRDAHRSAAVRSGGERQEPGRDGDRRPAARPAGAEAPVVRVAGDRTGERLGVAREAELGGRGLAEAHAPGVVEPAGEVVGFRGDVVGEGPRSVAGRHAGAGDEVLVGERHPPDRQGVREGPDRGGPGPRLLGGHLGERAESRVEPGDPREVVLGEFERRHLTVAEALELLERREVVQVGHRFRLRSLTTGRCPGWLVTQVTNH